MSQSVFVPFSEAVLQAAGAELGELVPFHQEYQCVRLLDGTYDFSPLESAAEQSAHAVFQSLDSAVQIGHAA